jgi:hypothetical protein
LPLVQLLPVSRLLEVVRTCVASALSTSGIDSFLSADTLYIHLLLLVCTVIVDVHKQSVEILIPGEGEATHQEGLSTDLVHHSRSCSLFSKVSTLSQTACLG